jgi:hypothetical protein
MSKVRKPQWGFLHCALSCCSTRKDFLKEMAIHDLARRSLAIFRKGNVDKAKEQGCYIHVLQCDPLTSSPSLILNVVL